MLWSRVFHGFLLAFVLSCGPDKSAPKGIVIYPTSDTLPENLLRFYVRFSHPMKAINNLKNIRLMDKNNQVVEGVIFNNVHELWDDQQKQLTLIMDPARVKTGLSTHNRLGRALVPGHSYHLVIEKMETVEQDKVKPFKKKFMVVSADTIAPSINLWDIRRPQVGSLDPLQIVFPESVDVMSLFHRLTISNDNGDKLEGTVEIGSNEKQWMFTPLEYWGEGKYTIYINARFADPSGNNLNGLFDHRTGSLKYEKEGETLKIPFSL